MKRVIKAGYGTEPSSVEYGHFMSDRVKSMKTAYASFEVTDFYG